MELFILVCSFGGAALFILAGIQILTQGWESYEEHYVRGAARSLDAIWLTIPPQVLLYLSVACGFATALVVALLSGSIWGGIPAGLAAMAVPKLVLYRMKRSREKQFEAQLPDALLNMANSLKAGFSFPQSMELIAREMENPIRQEFGLAAQEMRLGVEGETAIGHLGDRLPSPDLDLLRNAVAIARQTGGNLTEVLEKISTMIRERQRIEGRIRSLSAMGRMQGWVMALLPLFIGLYLYAFQPEYFAPLIMTTAGWVLLGLCGLGIAIGGYFVYKIVSIDV